MECSLSNSIDCWLLEISWMLPKLQLVLPVLSWEILKLSLSSSKSPLNLINPNLWSSTSKHSSIRDNSTNSSQWNSADPSFNKAENNSSSSGSLKTNSPWLSSWVTSLSPMMCNSQSKSTRALIPIKSWPRRTWRLVNLIWPYNYRLRLVCRLITFPWSEAWLCSPLRMLSMSLNRFSKETQTWTYTLLLKFSSNSTEYRKWLPS